MTQIDFVLGRVAVRFPAESTAHGHMRGSAQHNIFKRCLTENAAGRAGSDVEGRIMSHRAARAARLCRWQGGYVAHGPASSAVALSN